MDDLLSFLSTAELGIVTLVVAGFLVSWARFFPDLKTKSGHGIVALELPKGTEGAQQILAAWQRKGLMKAARRSITVDWLFIVLYVLALVCGGVLVARAGEALGGLDAADAKTVALVLAIAAVVAGLLDVLENLGMKRMLDGHVQRPVPQATTWVSRGKWALLFLLALGLLVVPLYGWLA